MIHQVLVSFWLLLFVASSQGSDDDNCLYVNIDGVTDKIYFAPNVCFQSYTDGSYTSTTYECINDGSVQLQIFTNEERCRGTPDATGWFNVSDGYDLNCASTAQDCSIKTRIYDLGDEANCNNLSAANYDEIVNVYGMCDEYSSNFCSEIIDCQIGMQTIAYYTNENCDCNGQVSFVTNYTSNCNVGTDSDTSYFDVSTTCNIPYSNQINFNSNNNNNNRMWTKQNQINKMKKKLNVFNTLKHEIMTNAQQS